MQERARADAHRDLGGAGFHLYPINNYVIAEEGPRPESAGDNEDARRRAVVDGVVGDNPQAVAGADGAARGGDRHDVERRVRPELVGHRKPLERPGEIEHLDFVKDQDGNVCSHGDLVAYRRIATREKWRCARLWNTVGSSKGHAAGSDSSQSACARTTPVASRK